VGVGESGNENSHLDDDPAEADLVFFRENTPNGRKTKIPLILHLYRDNLPWLVAVYSEDVWCGNLKQS
jgi:hypothetical protein